MRAYGVLCRCLLASILLTGFAMPGELHASQAAPGSFKRSLTLPVFTDGLEMRQARFALELAYANIGIKVSFVTRPALRALFEADSGQLDGDVVRDTTIEASYPNLVRVDTPMFRYSGSIFMLKSGGELPVNLEAASHLPVGIVRGARRIELETRGWPQLVVTNDYGAAIRMLKIGRISAVLGPYEAIRNAILSNQFNEGEFQSREMYNTLVFHYLHKSNADIVPALNAQLNRFRGKHATVLDGLRADNLKDFPRQ